ncbi:MAG: 3-deoxy-manno-octulosonate cytidylyltransferase [Alphaproteobacteria bacterium]|jgi:3-deoxy-manno-octulosonate cytidylyltransferase (CMP-KDO synthetase)|nr:3-deoxy-manno-octulosonate cytidylyltransferase [Alphaproteobacteria bacterium]
MKQQALVVIPARLASVRLPDKPLADIHGEAMIVHVWRRAVEADIGPVLVACAEPEIVDVIEAVGGRAVLTDPEHPSGSDRVWEAVQNIDPDGRYGAIVNLQGDLPTMEPAQIRLTLELLADGEVDISTLAAEIVEDYEREETSVVKAVISLPPGARQGRGLYFTRTAAPSGPGPLYHHIGIYGYRRAALARFIALPRGHLEQRERLEQLRALEAGMRIQVGLVDRVPFGVDTPADLDRARRALAPKT